MKYTFFAFLTFYMLFSVTAFSQQPQAISSGDPAPSFSIKDQYGNFVSYQPGTGKPAVLIMFDRYDYEQAISFIAATRDKYAGTELQLLCVASTRDVSILFRSFITKKLRKPNIPSVLLDWKGVATGPYNYNPEHPNIIVIGRDSNIAYIGAIHEGSKADVLMADIAIKHALMPLESTFGIPQENKP